MNLQVELLSEEKPYSSVRGRGHLGLKAGLRASCHQPPGWIRTSLGLGGYPTVVAKSGMPPMILWTLSNGS